MELLDTINVPAPALVIPPEPLHAPKVVVGVLFKVPKVKLAPAATLKMPGPVNVTGRVLWPVPVKLSVPPPAPKVSELATL